MPDTYVYRRAEWAAQKASIMGWPGLNGTLKDYPDRLARATEEVSRISVSIANFQPVTVIVGAERMEEAQTHFAEVDTPFDIKVHRVEGDSSDIWTRDFAPTFVIQNGPGAERSLVGLNLNFNGWGGRYPTPTNLALAQTFCRDMGINCKDISIVTEGGSLETDGEGTLLLTESSIHNDNRNPGKSREDIEHELVRAFGVEKVIWIPGRKGIDSRDCHIDSLVRFARPGVLLLSKANEVKKSDWTVVYEEARDILSSATDAKGRPFDIVEVEEPDEDLFDGNGFDHSRPVRSYANFVLVNGGIILPQFGDPAHDAAAIRVAQRLFGDQRRIMPVLIEELPLLGSGAHSSTQEIPLLP
ncbi:hypothetical protein PLICBS_010130 [Purpureocillium lilacinum]|uniref:uncharacterized protein n=1 Tax=Purpureocillium lilacinum TaxID=33203 RepID=UPI0020865CE5|nr:hypothetical protein PLICBS_010130 [Purpureocillium lilacinum]